MAVNAMIDIVYNTAAFTLSSLVTLHGFNLWCRLRDISIQTSDCGLTGDQRRTHYIYFKD
jgi:hypothetical protein